jgi:putative PIN family toxin of toxin-antitoxin system
VTRICLDSNVLVAAFLARGLCADVLRLVLSGYDLVIPEIVAEEVRLVLTTKLKASPSALSAVEGVLERCSLVPNGNVPCPISLRDPDDERVLAAALAAGVEILVSGDQDLLVAAEESPIRILSPRAFLTLVRGGTL